MNETYAAIYLIEGQWDRSDDRAAALKKNVVAYYKDKQLFIAKKIQEIYGWEVYNELLNQND